MGARLTSGLHDWPAFRVTIEPTPGNGLREVSQAMIDKTTAAPRAKIGSVIGRVDANAPRSVRRALLAFLELDEQK